MKPIYFSHYRNEAMRRHRRERRIQLAIDTAMTCAVVGMYMWIVLTAIELVLGGAA